MSNEAGEEYLYEEEYKPCFLWTLILAPCLLPVVWHYHVRITDTTLSIGYSSDCASLTIDRANIVSVQELEVVKPILDWGGYGIRKQLPSFDTGYIPKKGPGVKMVIKNAKGKELSYTFISDDAARVCEILTS